MHHDDTGNMGTEGTEQSPNANRKAGKLNTYKFLGEKRLTIPENVEILLQNGAKIKGPCILEEGVKINDYAIVESSYIGENCIIDANSIIIDSSLERNNTISSGANIRSCMILENSNIYYNSTIVESIIGRNVTIGIGVRIPCRRLKALKEGRAIDKKVVTIQPYSRNHQEFRPRSKFSED